MKIGVLGSGSLGQGFIASSLRAGFAVVAFDLAPEALETARRAGAETASSPADLASRCEVLIVALPDTPEIMDAVAAAESSLRPGTVVLIMSTVARETPIELGRRLAPLGVSVLDCPVSGGPSRAAAGELAIMVGGDEDAFARVRTVLDALGSSVIHVGPLGHGALTKLANNLMGAVIIEGIAEGLTLLAKAGVDVRRAAEAIAAGSGSSWILREWIPETLFREDYERRFSLDLMCKDMRIVEATAAALDVPVPACAVARETFERAVAAGHGNEDFSRAVSFHAEAAGTSLT